MGPTTCPSVVVFRMRSADSTSGGLGLSSRSERNAKALTCLIVWSVALGGLFAAIVALSPAARAGTCDQVSVLITGDWTVTTPQVCTGITYTVDGSVTINAGGSLTLVNGGLMFSMDRAHAGYALTVNAGGELVLDHSIVTTNPAQISPYIKLPLTVSGANSRFTMRNGAALKFPGWFNATGATIDITGSTITGFTDSEIANSGLNTDENNDGPLIAWASTTASLYGSRIERIYENTTGGSGGNVALTASSSLYAYDTYIGVDFAESAVQGLHNELQVDGTSNAYLYDVTIDRTQDPVLMSAWQPAYRPAPGGNVFLLRWLRATIVDSTGFPVSGATIWSTLSPSGTTAQYPDNGLSATPSARTLAYLGKAASGANAWNHTDSNGIAVIPLYTDHITDATLPNAESFGNYQLATTFAATTGPGGVDFDPYPAINANNNTKLVTVSLPIQVRTGPDLTVQPGSATMNVLQNQPFTAYALISNQGQTTASGVSIAAYLDGNRATEIARVNGLTVVTSLNQTLNVAGISAVGAHTLMLVVDPDNTINEGGTAQESNNFANITLNVQPPPAGFTALLTPSAGQSVVSGSALSVTGYVRDSGSQGIGGVVLNIELRSGATVLATNSTMSDSNGLFVGTITVPQSTQDGSYTIVATPATTLIQPDSRAISVQRSSSFLFQQVPILGIQWWLFLVILAAAAAVAIGVSLYWKVYGLGKMVECGECGAFIPEDATTCPKCGVEFERDMAKCSNCQAWIPVDVKQCPECGVEFATGQLEMADYKEKMRLQYDEVVARFKQEASRQLGRSLSETEFQEWWRKQPTFLTFEDWLREEEEMRKMGSKPCPTCGTLNSVTANVCHKCGSLMRDQKPPTGGAVVAGAPARRVQARGPMSPPGPTNASAPIVQKRVIKKP
ncbi:MAG: hypothetical protein E6J93_08020, partial [Methanobacteriota archaeon]